MTTKQQLNEASKFLSYILRHEPQAIGLQLDSEGWGEIESLIAGATNIGKALDIHLIHEIVNNSDKNRFSISENGQRIRAVQGHSTTNVNINHLEKTPPEFLYHGTASRFLDSIRQQGLIAGTRHYVHLSQDVATAINVGQRHGSPVVIKIEALRMSQQGFKFFQADNGVWLISSIPADQLTFDACPLI
ncbi:RNA 2'-phosphotransferase [Pseudomonas sp. FW300-N2F2]|uniref:RNA 2'-phosphotransferase n=1 Tax=Pseudomonas sp. FW300-N2F2 TaxID=2751320 RepID=UPI001A934F8C|nr:RNA 2'-phosphotransferase [Pseudomonas sp. FW300-N2F2]